MNELKVVIDDNVATNLTTSDYNTIFWLNSDHKDYWVYCYAFMTEFFYIRTLFVSLIDEIK